MSKNLCILNEDNKKKMTLVPKNVVHFEFFTNEMERERSRQDFSNKVIVVNATSVLIFQYKNTRNFHYYKGKSAKEIADMCSLKIRTVYNIISRVKKDRSQIKTN